MNQGTMQTMLARVMIIGVLISAALIIFGLVWFLPDHMKTMPGDHIFSGEPKYFENVGGMIHRSFELRAVGEKRSIIMIGILLLMLNPLVRVGLAAVGFLSSRDMLYAGISLFVFLVLSFSFFL